MPVLLALTQAAPAIHGMSTSVATASSRKSSASACWLARLETLASHDSKRVPMLSTDFSHTASRPMLPAPGVVIHDRKNRNTPSAIRVATRASG